MRAADNTKIEDVLTLLTDKWKLKLPNLLISVTGGAKDFELKPKLKQLFNLGLMKAATSTGIYTHCQEYIIML